MLTLVVFGLLAGWLDQLDGLGGAASAAATATAITHDQAAGRCRQQLGEGGGGEAESEVLGHGDSYHDACE